MSHGYPLESMSAARPPRPAVPRDRSPAPPGRRPGRAAGHDASGSRAATSAPAAASPAVPSPRIGAVARVLDRLTRRWTLELFDMDLQLDGAEIEAELRSRPD